MRRLILFDIDATLVLTGGAGGRAMNRAFEVLHGVAGAFDGIPMAGRTDPAILDDALVRAGVRSDAATHDAFRVTYLRLLREEIVLPAPRKLVMPGVRLLLDALARRDDEVCFALLTGNYAEGARVKLEYFDLWRFFRCGAFGDDHAERPKLLPIALSRVEACGAGRFESADTVVIGDTPYDVACALASGARAIGVATGSSNAATLAARGAHHVFEDLGDTESVMKVILEQEARR
jgi:phosphoglycolate phosphatase-like HAD superfamily hydrolase